MAENIRDILEYLESTAPAPVPCVGCGKLVKSGEALGYLIDTSLIDEDNPHGLDIDKPACSVACADKTGAQ